MRRAASTSSARAAGVSGFPRTMAGASMASRVFAAADGPALSSRAAKAQATSSGVRGRGMSSNTAGTTASESFGLPKSSSSSTSTRMPVISGTVLRPLLVAGARQMGPLLLELLDAADEDEEGRS